MVRSSKGSRDFSTTFQPGGPTKESRSSYGRRYTCQVLIQCLLLSTNAAGRGTSRNACATTLHSRTLMTMSLQHFESSLHRTHSSRASSVQCFFRAQLQQSTLCLHGCRREKARTRSASTGCDSNRCDRSIPELQRILPAHRSDKCRCLRLCHCQCRFVLGRKCQLHLMAAISLCCKRL